MDEKRVRELAKAMRMQVNKIIPLGRELIMLMQYAEELDDLVNGKTTPTPPTKKPDLRHESGNIIEFPNK